MTLGAKIYLAWLVLIVVYLWDRWDSLAAWGNTVVATVIVYFVVETAFNIYIEQRDRWIEYGRRHPDK